MHAQTSGESRQLALQVVSKFLILWMLVGIRLNCGLKQIAWHPSTLAVIRVLGGRKARVGAERPALNSVQFPGSWLAAFPNGAKERATGRYRGDHRV